MKIFAPVFLAILAAAAVIWGVIAYNQKLAKDEAFRIHMLQANERSLEHYKTMMDLQFRHGSDSSVTELERTFAYFDNTAKNSVEYIRRSERGSDAERVACARLRMKAGDVAYRALCYAPNSKAWLKEKFAKYPELQVDVDELAKPDPK